MKATKQEPIDRAPCHAGEPSDALERVLGSVASSSARATVLLASGRRVELQAHPDADRIVVRARSGRVVLEIQVTDEGPRLAFESAELELRAARRLEITAGEIAVEARDSLTWSAGGDVNERIGGHHHRRVAGDERVEAARIELQANDGGLAVRAVERIALDGEHIALNDDPSPEPFGWSALAARGEDHGR